MMKLFIPHQKSLVAKSSEKITKLLRLIKSKTANYPLGIKKHL